MLTRYWLTIWPIARHALNRWRLWAATIPDPQLRALALATHHNEHLNAEGAAIFWCDEEGVSSDDYRGRGYARPGHTPVKEVAGGHQRVNVVSAISDRGEAHFLTFTGAMDTAVFLTFLERLLAATPDEAELGRVVERVRAATQALALL